MPGGGSLAGETADQTLARDVQEEGGLQVDGLQRIGEAWECVYAVEEDRYYCKLGVFFSGMGIEQFEDQEDDHQLIWLSPEQALTFLIHGIHCWANSEPFT